MLDKAVKKDVLGSMCKKNSLKNSLKKMSAAPMQTKPPVVVVKNEGCQKDKLEKAMMSEKVQQTVQMEKVRRTAEQVVKEFGKELEAKQTVENAALLEKVKEEARKVAKETAKTTASNLVYKQLEENLKNVERLNKAIVSSAVMN